MASPARVWGTAFACHLVNSTQEFVNQEANIDRQDVMICPNSEISSHLDWKASHAILELISKSMMSKDISLNHCKPSNKPKASPTSTW